MSNTRLVTPKEASDHYQVKVNTLYKWRAAKRGPRYSKVGGLIRYRWSDLERYFEARAKGGAA